MMIICPSCGNPVTLANRASHAVVVARARVRDGSAHWSAIASCDARLVGAGDSLEAAIVALDALADRAAQNVSRIVELPTTSARAPSVSQLASPSLECVVS